jgi:UDP-N-acetylmuramoylalanine--D-glutamate ligase
MERNVLVMGLGRSGCAAAHLLRNEGYKVIAVDQGGGSVGSEALGLLVAKGVDIHLHADCLPAGRFALGVVSPGIPDHSPWVQQARGQCDEVISELELGYRYCDCPILAITGTNGKSTLTCLIDSMLRAAGLRSAAGGNLGVPLCELALGSHALDWVVAEVSSFQLELVRYFRPRGGIFLNLQPDHLDRHGTMEHYLALKSRLFANMQAGDMAVVEHALLPMVQAVTPQAENGGLQWMTFGGAEADWCYDPYRHAVTGVWGGREVCMSLSQTYFDNPVLGAAAAAAVGLVHCCCGVGEDVLGQALVQFQPLPHRMQVVGVWSGIRYIDDSKATNLAAMVAAVSMQDRPVRLIAGGLLKENDVDWVKQVLKKHVSCVYLIGTAGKMLEQAWADALCVCYCETLENAMKRIFREVLSGDVVLLSPGCASFDQFRSYAERGDRFSGIVVAANEKE